MRDGIIHDFGNKVAANEDVFDPNEPKGPAVRKYIAGLEKLMVNNEQVNAALTKRLKAKMGFFGDGTGWSDKKLDQFDTMMTMALSQVARSHLRHKIAVKDVTPEQLIKHGCYAIDAVAHYMKQEAALGRNS